MKNKVKYITELLHDTIDLRKKKLGEINAMLEGKGYMMKDDSYKYLIKMPMDSVSEENVESLIHDMETKQKEYDDLMATREQEIWLHELQKLRKAYDDQFMKAKSVLEEESTTKKKPAKKIAVKK